ncbi:MAG: cytotoxic translational repressor of toxin-antitoxin stability system [Candidatus Omnitrophota bacterium]|jgi:mRNA-degrading endonuclease RelE of RelBE toxin-antitoxin system|nr:MAG: cytotoxic translational repressor of toxin-antitoxin stability system [Candidatus Omnitrophota bacterium]
MKKWNVTIKKSVIKKVERLPQGILNRLAFLIREMEFEGPVRGNWPNYSKLGVNKHHCHLKKGHPTYVAVWVECEKDIHIEVIYVGSHEKAPY